MKTLLYPLLLSASAAMILAAPASAAVVVSQDSLAPTEDILRSAPDDSFGTANWNGYGDPETAMAGWRDLGQTFQSGTDGNLKAFTYKLSSFGAQALGAAFTVQIFEAPTAQTTFTAATLLSEQKGFLPVALEENQYITFTLDETVALKADLFYTIYLHFDTPGASTVAGTRRQLVFTSANYPSAENPLGSGSHIWVRQNPFETSARGNYALTTYIHGTAAIPEPQTVALVTGAAGVLWIGRQLSRKTSKAGRE